MKTAGFLFILIAITPIFMLYANLAKIKYEYLQILGITESLFLLIAGVLFIYESKKMRDFKRSTNVEIENLIRHIEHLYNTTAKK